MRRLHLLSTPFLAMAAGILLAGWCHAGGPAVTWRSGTVVPKGVGYAMQIEQILAPGILAATQNQVCLKTYFGGILGDDEDFIAKVKSGDLEACGLSAQGALMACPEMAVTALPFMFKNYDEVDLVKKAMYPVFDGMLGNNGFKLILWLDQAFDQFYSVNTPLARMGEFQQAKFITWNGELEQGLFRRLGVQPLNVDIPDFNQTLRRGEADAFIGPPIWCVATQLYSVIRYINTTEIRYSPAMLLVASREWNALDKTWQDGILASREDWQTRFCQASRADNARCLEAMFRYGVQEVKMPPGELEALKAAVLPLWDDMAGELYSPELLETVTRLLEKHRQAY